VTSECNIFALSVKDPGELPADIRDELMTFKNGYRTPDTPSRGAACDLGLCQQRDSADEMTRTAKSRKRCTIGAHVGPSR
jgi:hypothetical protein